MSQRAPASPNRAGRPPTAAALKHSSGGEMDNFPASRPGSLQDPTALDARGKLREVPAAIAHGRPEFMIPVRQILLPPSRLGRVVSRKLARPKRPLRHYIITRLGIGMSRPAFFRRRLAIMRATLLRSLASQTCRDFEWIIFTDV